MKKRKKLVSEYQNKIIFFCSISNAYSTPVQKSSSTEFVPKLVAETKQTPTMGPKVLSLEEKKRLAAEQEQTMKMRNQSPLQPIQQESDKKQPTLTSSSSFSSILATPTPLGPLIRPPPPSNPVLNGTNNVLTPLTAPPTAANPVFTPKVSQTPTALPSADWSSFLNTPGSGNSFGGKQSKGKSAFDDLVVFPTQKQEIPALKSQKHQISGSKTISPPSANKDLADLLG